VAKKTTEHLTVESPEAFFNRELSWLNFARRVLAQVEDPDVPLLERIKFAGIMGMLHDEFFMKRVGGMKRRIRRGDETPSFDGRRPIEELMACREEILTQINVLARVISLEIRPQLQQHGIPVLDYAGLSPEQCVYLEQYFADSVLPILTPLAVDAEHPFPFISSLGLNFAIEVREGKGQRKRFVRLKVPGNRPRLVPLPGEGGFALLEQIISSNLAALFPEALQINSYVFRVTRGTEGDEAEPRAGFDESEPEMIPGSIVSHVTDELKARRFAGVTRLEVGAEMPEKLQNWLAAQLGIGMGDIYPTDNMLGISDLVRYRVDGHEHLRDPRHEPVTHPRLAHLELHDAEGIFEEIKQGDFLLHHPYHSFDTSVLRFIQSAALDPQTLAIKLTIYRTSSDSPIVLALAEAARRGKQVAVLVEITARLDEAPNIAWGRLLEKEGVHVAYGVERLKTHVKLALVVREEAGVVRRYAHVGTGNYHTVTARLYEDLGILTCDESICADVAQVFNELTGATAFPQFRKMIVAPIFMRQRFVELIQREVEHARGGRPAGIRAKMNQLQDDTVIRELYRASQAGVPVCLNVRGLCCLRPGLPGLSENIRVFSVVGRFLEHGRIYRFENGGQPEYYLGSADWMRRNLDRRVETIMPVQDEQIKRELGAILDVFETDNYSAWDGQPDGSYLRRRPAEGEERRASQEVFIRLAAQSAGAPVRAQSAAALVR
jgi:polyphosphate kinase